jgi:ketosteroid isomerase-like protein
MTRLRPLLAGVAACLVAGCAAQPRSTADVPSISSPGDPVTTLASEQLVAAERAFAARSTARGTRDAFLAYLADDAVLFVPRASPGRPFFEAQPAASTSRLQWAPTYAEVSAAGDLGFTTGPYEARANTSVDSVTAYGHFVSIWKRDPGTNAWKVAIDLGTTNARPPAARRLRAAMNAAVARREISARDADADTSSGLGDRAMTPLGADSLFSSRAAAEGTAAALSAASVDVRIHREGDEPSVGRPNAVESLRRARERFVWHPEVGVEAQSSDLGYTYGTYGGIAPGAPEEGAYVRIWRRGPDGRWRLALDITNPFPR